MKKVITIDDEGKSLEKALLKFGIKTEYNNGFLTPQEFRFVFNGGAYTDSKLKRAMNILNNMNGYTYEKNKNGGFTVIRNREYRQFVSCGDCEDSIEKALSADSDGKQKTYISFGLGTDGYIVTNFDECAHILIAGSTNSGKSVLLNSLIMQILCFSNSNVLLIDPKNGAEFGIYELDIHNRIEKVAKTTWDAVECLSVCAAEMDKRYSEMEKKGLKKYDGRRLIIVIDELADLMLTSRNEVENHIVRIAQKGRAAGIHLIVATQDPRASVVTGLIKYNLPTKVCLKTANARHSMNVIDCGKGADLLDKGDGYVKLPSSVDLKRCQCAFITDREIINILTK